MPACTCRLRVQLSIIMLLFVLPLLSFLTACQSAYYGAWETLGYHKRDILVERVEKARDEQEATKEQFRSALDAFQAVVTYDAGELQATYDRLQAELDNAEDRATEVRDRIESVNSVATALFEEWQAELDQYASDELRRKSAQQLAQTRDQYAEMYAAMQRASSRMDPVLAVFNDHVLFLKHNLNARAIASLEGELSDVQGNVEVLVRDMEEAISEANAFIDAMGGNA